MQPNAQGMCFSYYGMYDNNVKPRLEVHYFMINEHVKKMIDKEKENFKIVVFDVITTFQKTMKEMVKKQAEDMNKMNESIMELVKFTDNLIKLNELKSPPKAKPKKSVFTKPKDEDDDEDDNI